MSDESTSKSTAERRRQLESLSREALAEHQLSRLNELLSTILPANRFYAEKLANAPQQLEHLDQLCELPLTTKEDLIADDATDHLPTNLTWPLEQYVRYHQTSGTRGRPLSVCDTADDWAWWIESWQYVLDAADITSADRALLAVFVWPVHWVLECLRCACRARHSHGSRWRHEHARTA